METVWESSDLNHPRKQMRRLSWMSLNGLWRFQFDDLFHFSHPSEIKAWEMKIEVPFAPESEKSGIADQGFHYRCWYQRDFKVPVLSGRRLFLNFGAVDYAAKVWVNEHYVGAHDGGHTPFSFDITSVLKKEGIQTVTVCAADDPLDLTKPRGKQDWHLKPHSIWYPRTTGIWQTVWLEEVPEIYIDQIRWEPHLERFEIGCEICIAGNDQKNLHLQITLTAKDQLLVNDSYEVISGEIHRRIALSDPGVDDYRNELLWSPEKPTLIQAQIRLFQKETCIDEVQSYTALRSVATQQDRFVLNGRPYFMRLLLDQGYWPETLMTPGSEDVIRRDIALIKAAGFNGVRKHQKIEDPNFLYWADVMGLLVWEEMPSAYRFTTNSVERVAREWIEVIDRDYNHPCVIVWVPFNESWGVPDLPQKVAHQHCVQAMYHLTKTLDATRPVIGNDGWESTATDILGIHDYDRNPSRLIFKYGREVPITDLLNRKRSGGRLLTLEGYPHTGQPVVLTEFGGIAYVDPSKNKNVQSWGYSVETSSKQLQKKYRELMTAVNQIDLFSGFCYTQFVDTFQEANGLFYPDRMPKFPLEEIRAATLGGEAHEELTATPGPSAG